MSSVWRARAMLAAVAMGTGCGEFRSPAEIVEPQLLGIRTQPAALAPGDEARMQVFVAGVNGPIDDVPVAWEVVEGPGGAPPLGTMVEGDDGEVRYAAPTDFDPAADPEIAVIQGVVALPHRDVVAIKAVPIGSRRANPEIERVTASGVPIADGVTVAAGDEVELAVEASVALDDVNDVMWAATVGELERFLRTPATWTLADNAAGTGWLYVVVRDGEGGADWAAFPVDIEF